MYPIQEEVASIVMGTRPITTQSETVSDSFVTTYLHCIQFPYLDVERGKL